MIQTVIQRTRKLELTKMSPCQFTLTFWKLTSPQEISRKQIKYLAKWLQFKCQIKTERIKKNMRNYLLTLEKEF
jgi:hypothetical protein